MYADGVGATAGAGGAGGGVYAGGDWTAGAVGIGAGALRHSLVSCVLTGTEGAACSRGAGLSPTPRPRSYSSGLKIG